jgi:hypothetical protein
MGIGSSDALTEGLCSGKASGTGMGGGVDGAGKHDGRSLEKALSLVSESVDHSSEHSESAAVSSSELTFSVSSTCRSGCCCLVLKDLLFRRNPIRLWGRGGTSDSLTCDMFVNRDLTRDS